MTMQKCLFMLSNTQHMEVIPEVTANLQGLPTMDAIIGEVANATDWKRQEYGGDYNYLSSGEPAGEHPEWHVSFLAGYAGTDFIESLYKIKLG